MKLLLSSGLEVALDEAGHLQNPGDWNPEVALELARRDGLELDEDRWWLIGFVREYHAAYGNPPLMRSVVAALRERRQDSSLTTRELYRWFPDGPVRLACKYGGLPRPDWCI